MTDDRMALWALLEKASDSELLRELIAFITGRLMELEVDDLCGAAFHERSANCVNHRNGYRERHWETSAAG